MISKILLIVVLFIFLCVSDSWKWFYKNQKEHQNIELLITVFFNPVLFALLFWGGLVNKIGWILLITVIAITIYYEKRLKISEKIIFQYMVRYALISLSVCGIFVSYATQQTLEQVQTLRIISIFILIVIIANMAIEQWSPKKEIEDKITIDIKSDDEKKDDPYNEKVKFKINKIEKIKLTGIDILAIALFMLFYGCIVFYKLGSTTAPQTSVSLLACNYDDLSSQKSPPRASTLDLDLGETRDVSQIVLYQGDTDNCVVKVEYFSEKQQAWIPVQQALSINHNFEWNVIEVHEKASRIRVIERTKDAIYSEMIIYDEEGNVVNPVNADDYAALFDEQDLFPEYNTYYYHTIFDEGYYASSEHQFLNHKDMNEKTHPPLGKAIMSLGIVLFGTTPFGWRFIVAVCGILMMPVMYMILREMFQKMRYAVFGCLLFSTDFMHLTLSRIGTPDNFIVFIILLEIALMYHILYRFETRLNDNIKITDFIWVILCIAVGGIGVAVKWTGVFALAGIGIVYVGYLIYRIYQKKNTMWIWRRLLIFSFFVGILVVSGIYVLSFAPFYQQMGYQNIWQAAIQRSLDMLKFHEGAIFTHEYASPWYTWPLDVKPLTDAASHVADERISTVATFGNPILWWIGIPTFFVTLYRAFYNWDKKAIFLSVIYMALLLPWAWIERTAFIYQYYGSSIVSIMIIVYVARLLDGKNKKYMMILGALSTFIFVAFLPVLTGIPVKESYVRLCLEWMKNWKFT